MRFLPVVVLLAACNSTMQGETAPRLPQLGWLDPDGTEVEFQSDGRWVLVEFFSPG